MLITAIVVWFVGKTLIDEWQTFRGTPIELHPGWGMIALSCIIVLATYAVLIETWRRMIVAWGDQLDFGNAARIWFISNLGKYVPGKIWGIGAMAELARQRNVSPAAAAGSSIINVVVNIATGFVVALVIGWTAIDALSHGHARLGVTLAAAMIAGLLLLPVTLPAILAVARKATGRALAFGVLPHRVIYISIAGNLVAWTMYGAAFRIFVSGVLGHATGRLGDYVAVYASSYVVGYLALLIPGGLGAREAALTDGLHFLGLANVGQGLIIAGTSRLWLTALEIIPAVVYLARGARRRPHAPQA